MIDIKFWMEISDKLLQIFHHAWRCSVLMADNPAVRGILPLEMDHLLPKHTVPPARRGAIDMVRPDEEGHDQPHDEYSQDPLEIGLIGFIIRTRDVSSGGRGFVFVEEMCES